MSEITRRDNSEGLLYLKHILQQFMKDNFDLLQSYIFLDTLMFMYKMIDNDAKVLFLCTCNGLQVSRKNSYKIIKLLPHDY